jgi:transcriptional antiterminator RfaH
MAAPYWAVARTELGREDVAAHFLGLAGYSVYLPRIRDTRVRQGRRIVVTPPLFPHYIFVRIENGFWWEARKCFGVMSIIMTGDEPGRLSDSVIDGLRARERDGFVVLDAAVPRFRSGDSVRVSRGPMEGIMGLFAGLRGTDRVDVLLSFLGSERATVLPAADIEPVSALRYHRTPWGMSIRSRRERARQRQAKLSAAGAS